MTANTTDELIEKIFNVYKANNGSLTKDPDFWLTCARAQIREAEDDLKAGRIDHMAKEFADLAFVAIDGLRKMGFDAIRIMNERIKENGRKDLSGRTKEYYEAKANGEKPA